MEDAKRQNRKRKPAGDDLDLRVVAINCNPAPDAQDRLRRLFTILLKHAAEERRDAPGENAPADHPPADEHAGEDA